MPYRNKSFASFRLGIFLILGFLVVSPIVGFITIRSETLDPRLLQERREDHMARQRFENLRRTSSNEISPLAVKPAIRQVEALPRATAASMLFGLIGSWQFIGPQQITNGQGLDSMGLAGSQALIPVSDRVAAIALGLALATIYVGATDGGVWESTDGDPTWADPTTSVPRSKARTDGIVERFHKGALSEFYRAAFRRKIYSSLEGWLKEYNEMLPHQGRWCSKTLMKTFVKSLPLAQERLISPGAAAGAVIGQ